MMKCDYQEGIRGLGPVTVLKFLKKHGSLRAYFTHPTDFKFKLENKEEYLLQIERTVEIFQYRPDLTSSATSSTVS